jgi:hypothetical protein
MLQRLQVLVVGAYDEGRVAVYDVLVWAFAAAPRSGPDGTSRWHRREIVMGRVLECRQPAWVNGADNPVGVQDTVG